MFRVYVKLPGGIYPLVWQPLQKMPRILAEWCKTKVFDLSQRLLQNSLTKCIAIPQQPEPFHNCMWNRWDDMSTMVPISQPSGWFRHHGNRFLVLIRAVILVGHVESEKSKTSCQTGDLYPV